MSENVQNRLEEVEQKAQGPGRMLREARRMLQIDQEELATRLNLDLRWVDAIERDDFEHMPPATFIRGYLRAFAREVDLDPDEVVAEFDQVAEQDSPTLKSRHSVQRQADLSDSPMRWVSILLVLALIALVSTWAVRNMEAPGDDVLAVDETAADTGSERTAAAAPATQTDVVMAPAVGPAPGETAVPSPEPAVSSSADEAPESSATSTAEPVAVVEEASTQTVEPAAETSGSPSALAETEALAAVANDAANDAGQATDQTPAQAAPQAASEAPTEQPVSEPVAVAEAEPTPEAPVSEPEAVAAETTESGEPTIDPEAPLIVSFTDDCWTSIQAADGERLVYRVVTKGAILNIHGEAPFKITLGNSDAVKLVYQGKLFDHQPFSRGKIARFVLNADGTAN